MNLITCLFHLPFLVTGPDRSLWKRAASSYGLHFPARWEQSLCSFQAFHNTGVARHVGRLSERWCVLQFDKGCTAWPPGWRLAEDSPALPPETAWQNDGKLRWPCCESHLTHWVGGQLPGKALKMAFFPPVASFPPAQKPSPGHLRSLRHQIQRSAVPVPASLHPRGNLERNNKLHVRDTYTSS